MSKKTIKKKPTRDITIRIGYGLPGAGKSTFFKTLDKYNTMFVDVDKIVENSIGLNHVNPTIWEILDIAKDGHYNIPRTIIIDALTKDEKNIASYISVTYSWLYDKFPYELSESGDYDYHFKVIIDYWEPNVNLCIFNDLCRNRYNKAEHTIKTMNIKYPEISKIVREFVNKKINESDITVIVHQTEKADPIETIINSSYSYNYDSSFKKIQSDTWNPKEEAPRDFDIFDDILFILKPDIPYLLYKRIWKEAEIWIEHNTITDYYSPHAEDSLCYAVNVDKLKEVLKKYNIL